MIINNVSPAGMLKKRFLKTGFPEEIIDDVLSEVDVTKVSEDAILLMIGDKVIQELDESMIIDSDNDNDGFIEVESNKNPLDPEKQLQREEARIINEEREKRAKLETTIAQLQKQLATEKRLKEPLPAPRNPEIDVLAREIFELEEEINKLKEEYNLQLQKNQMQKEEYKNRKRESEEIGFQIKQKLMNSQLHLSLKATDLSNFLQHENSLQRLLEHCILIEEKYYSTFTQLQNIILDLKSLKEKIEQMNFNLRPALQEYKDQLESANRINEDFQLKLTKLSGENRHLSESKSELYMQIDQLKFKLRESIKNPPANLPAVRTRTAGGNNESMIQYYQNQIGEIKKELEEKSKEREDLEKMFGNLKSEIEEMKNQYELLLK